MLNYGAVVYSKPAVWFNYLRHYVGDSTMDLAMHAYFDTYKFKHPYPEDFESILSEEIGKDLSWLFDKGIDSTAKIDYAIGKIGLGYGQTTVTIKNRGGAASPVLLGVLRKREGSRSYMDRRLSRKEIVHVQRRLRSSGHRPRLRGARIKKDKQPGVR